MNEQNPTDPVDSHVSYWPTDHPTSAPNSDGPDSELARIAGSDTVIPDLVIEDDHIVPDPAESAGSCCEPQCVLPSSDQPESPTQQPTNTPQSAAAEPCQKSPSDAVAEMFSHVEGEASGQDPAESLEEENWIGRILGAGDRYEVTDFLATGGMAKVYLAIDRNRNDVEVAVKVPFRKCLNTSTMRERFHRESLAMISLEHPGILRVMDTGSYAGTPYVVLQKLGGGNLRTRQQDVQAQAGTTDEISDALFSWLSPIAKALDFVHSREYIHRDVKPENILFDDHGHAFLSDFGIVRVLSGNDDSLGIPRTSFDTWMGTPGFVAPEIGTETVLDGRCDQYSLACVVYFCLTGKTPFPGKTMTEYRAAQVTKEVKPAHELNELVPPAVSVVLQRALSSSPDDRYESCIAFAGALSEAFVGQSAASDPIALDHDADLTSAKSKSSRRFRWIMLFLTTAVVVAFMSASQDVRHTCVTVIDGLAGSVGGSDKGDDDIGDLEDVGRQYFENGLKMLETGEPDDAITAFMLAMESDPAKPEYRAEYARACMHMAIRWDETPAEYRSGRHGNKSGTEWCQEALDQYAAAIRDGSEISSDALASWHHNRAQAQFYAGDLQAALNDANIAIELQPSNSKYYFDRAALLRRLGRDEQADEDEAEAARLESEN